MFFLTHQERKVIIFIGIIILFGAVLRFFRISSRLKNADESNTSAIQINSSLININKASQEDLEKLPGIGEKTAQNIISYRVESGEFKNVDDLKKVKGIGDKTVEALKDNVLF